MPWAVRLTDVVKAYGSGEVAMHALRGISLQVTAGQFVVVLGPSGSGKTMLMNLIGGMEPPTSGVVEVSGQDLSGLNDASLTAFRVESTAALLPFWSGFREAIARREVTQRASHPISGSCAR